MKAGVDAARPLPELPPARFVACFCTAFAALGLLWMPWTLLRQVDAFLGFQTPAELARDVALALLLLTLPAAALALLASPLLALWIAPDFARQSAPVLQLFSVGILINCLAHVPLTWLHGAGRFRAPALLHCAELPLFLAALWLLTRQWGLIGAAAAWLGRMVVDAAALFWLCHLERCGPVKRG